jgi:hypothetical protein
MFSQGLTATLREPAGGDSQAVDRARTVRGGNVLAWNLSCFTFSAS